MPGPVVLMIVFVLWVISFLYNLKLKEFGFGGNLIGSFCLGMIFIPAGILTGQMNGVVLTFAALAFFFNPGEEVASDALDVKGDEDQGSGFSPGAEVDPIASNGGFSNKYYGEAGTNPGPLPPLH